jgi:hypothetical protein
MNALDQSILPKAPPECRRNRAWASDPAADPSRPEVERVKKLERETGAVGKIPFGNGPDLSRMGILVPYWVENRTAGAGS